MTASEPGKQSAPGVTLRGLSLALSLIYKSIHYLQHYFYRFSTLRQRDDFLSLPTLTTPTSRSRSVCKKSYVEISELTINAAPKIMQKATKYGLKLFKGKSVSPFELNYFTSKLKASHHKMTLTYVVKTRKNS